MSGSSRSESQEEDSEEEYSSQSIASVDNNRERRKHNVQGRRTREECDGNLQSVRGNDDGEVDMNGSSDGAEDERDEEMKEEEKVGDDQYSEEEDEEEEEGEEDVGMAAPLFSRYI